jgi:predicted DNA-binding antitoxin AbrB/MazE fold protein
MMVPGLAFGQDSQGGQAKDQQQSSEQTQDDSQQQDRQKERKAADKSENASQRDKQKRRSGGKQTPEPQSATVEIKPLGWISIAADYDNDGRFDGVETIYAYDLEQAKQNSRKRSESRQDRRSNRSNQQQRETIKGTISKIRTEPFAGMDQEFVIAHVKTNDQGKACAVLGPKDKLAKLNLKEGDKVTVVGVKGRVNDRPVLLGRRVTHDDRRVSVDVEMPGSRKLKRVRGEILSTRTAQFRNRDADYLIAKVRLNNDKEQTVNLGPKSKVASLELSEGDKVSLLVRPGTINGEGAMIAEQIRANDKMVKLSPPKDLGNRQANRSQRDRQMVRSAVPDSVNDSVASKNRNRANRDRANQDRELEESDNGERSGENPSDQQAALGVAVAETDNGVQVQAVFPNSPAQKADLQQGDLILAINEAKVETADDLIKAIKQRKPDQQVSVKTSRDGNTQTTTIRLSSRAKLTNNSY